MLFLLSFLMLLALAFLIYCHCLRKARKKAEESGVDPAELDPLARALEALRGEEDELTGAKRVLAACLGRISSAGAHKWAPYVAGGFVLLCLLVEILVLALDKPRIPDNAMTSDLFVLEVSARKLGEHLSAASPGVDALIVTDSETAPETRRGKALLKGLREGFGASVRIEAVEVLGALAPSADETAMNPRFGSSGRPSAKEFDSVVRGYVTCRLIVSLTGLPPGFARMDLWRRKPKPKVAILNAAPEPFKQAMLAGVVVAVVSYDPKALRDLQYGPATRERCEQAFVLTTAAQVRAEHKR